MENYSIKVFDIDGNYKEINEYESEEVCKKVLNMIIEAIERGDKTFYMPE